MLGAPDDLEEAALAEAVLGGWGIQAVSLTYRAVGWGSHHWDVAGGDGGRWFVSVDELENKRVADSESLEDGFSRLSDSLMSAVALRETGAEFVVAPVLGTGRVAAVRFGGRFAVAVYPAIDGESFSWGEWSDELRVAVAGLVVRVHQAPVEARRFARTEDFGVPFRELTEAALGGWEPEETGPYTRAMVRLLRECADGVRAWLNRYDGLVSVAVKRSGPFVLTHGEPHPGNVMRAPDGWRLIDWDTVLLAPPERDLWSLDPGDGSVFSAYTAATGVVPWALLVELYRLGWDVKDLAYDVARFCRPHGDGADDVESWELFSSLVRRAGG